MLVVILGAGGHGQVVADILFHMWKSGRDLEIHGYLDNDESLTGKRLLGIRVLGPQSLLPEVGHEAVVAAIGDNAIRRRIYEELSPSQTFLTAIHPSAIISPDVKIGPGAMVCAGAIIGPGAVVGENAIINTGATVDHHNVIGAHAHVAPGVNLGGGVHVGEGAFIGIGASVIPGTSIGAGAVVGAGAAVIADVPAGETWVGVPARPKS
jgi:sugar O-acyltransferase (sialic acid O-acetyltransferase NeuD family)